MDRKPVEKYVEETHPYRKLWRKPWRKTKKGPKTHRMRPSQNSLSCNFDPPEPCTCEEDKSWQEYRQQVFNQCPSLSSAAKSAFFLGTAIVSVPTAELLDLPKLMTTSSMSLHGKKSAQSIKKSETRLKTLEEEAVSAALAAAAATAAAAAERARIAAQGALAIQAEQEMEATKAIEEARVARELAVQQEKENKGPSNQSGGLGYSILSKRKRVSKNRVQKSGALPQQQFNPFEVPAKKDQNAPIHTRPPPPMVSPRFAARLVELVSTAVPVSVPQYPAFKPTQPKRSSVIRSTSKGIHSPPMIGSVIGPQSSNRSQISATTNARSNRPTITIHPPPSGQTAHQTSATPSAPVHPSPLTAPTTQPMSPPHAYVPPGGHQLPARCSHISSTNHPTTHAAAPAGYQPQSTTNANQLLPGHQQSLAHQSAPTHEPGPAHQPQTAQQLTTARQPPPAYQIPPAQRQSTIPASSPPAAQPPPENQTSKTPVQNLYPPPPSRTPVQSYQPPAARTPVQPPPTTNAPPAPCQFQPPPQYSYGTPANNNQERPTYQQPPTNQYQPPQQAQPSFSLNSNQPCQPPNQAQPQQPSYSLNSNQSYQPPASHLYGTLPRKAQTQPNATPQTGNSTSEFAPPNQPTPMPHVTMAMLPNTSVNQNQWAQQQPPESSPPSKPRNQTQRPSSATRPSVGTLLRSGLRSLVRTSVSAAALDRPKQIETSVAWNTAKIAAPADDPAPPFIDKVLPPCDLSDNDSSVWYQQSPSQQTMPWSTTWQTQTVLPVFNETKPNFDIEQKQEMNSWHQDSCNLPLDVGPSLPTGQVPQTLYEANQPGSLVSLPQPYMPTDTTAALRAEWWQKSPQEAKSCSVRWDKSVSLPPLPPSRPNISQQQQQSPQSLSPPQRVNNIPTTTSNWLPPTAPRSVPSMWQNQSTFEDRDRKRTDVCGPNPDNSIKTNFQESMYQQAFFQTFDNGPFQQPPPQQQHYPETVLEEACTEDPQ